MAVVVPITTEFDASGVNSATSKFAKFSQTLSKSLQQAGADARKAFAQVEAGAQESTTAAQRLAAQIGKTADKLDADLTASKAAADALGRALGPEFAAKVGKNGLNKLVTDLNRAGVSIKEITAEADVLAAAIKQVDDVNLKHVSAEADQLDASLSRVGATTDRTGSVFANFAGNAAQEIPGVASAMGPLNVAIGQFAEYAAEGGVSLRNFAKALGPIALVSGALLLVKGSLADIANTKAFNKEDVDAFRKSLVEGTDAVGALRERLTEVGGLATNVFDPDAFFGLSGLAGKVDGWANILSGGTAKVLSIFSRNKTVDITAATRQVGLGIGEVTKLVTAGKPAIDKWAAAQRAAGNSSENLDLVVTALYQKIDNLAEAEKGAAVTKRFLTDTTNQTTSATQALTAATGFAQAALDANNQATEDAQILVANLTDAIFANIDAKYQQEDATYRAKKAIEAYLEAQKAAKRKPNDKKLEEEANQQLENASRVIYQTSKDTYELAKAQSTQTTEAGKAAEAAAKVLGGYEDLAATLGPNDPLRADLAAFIKELEAAARTYVATVRLDLPRGMIGGGTGAGGRPATTGIPGLTSAAASGAQPVYNITVNGATNSQETANLVTTTINRADQRQGRVGQ